MEDLLYWNGERYAALGAVPFDYIRNQFTSPQKTKHHIQLKFLLWIGEMSNGHNGKGTAQGHQGIQVWVDPKDFPHG
ncbi:hypothetical protein PP182_17935 [Maribacter sp. PR1]|uniref:Uncharacterized protein n=1 Tax=Maribacter cobaltidurans TaxID=1178778 RepID=A0ABU7IYA2_9FLAO|nr:MULTISPECIES: hypothetical protein [Maribacter]MDC6390573.1 hypothetical protein [Maribacter sp. PR1]MEE1977964.1 hypothetical protein [Maribacter cobaltidurans]